MAKCLLELRNIVKSFPGVLALSGINFTLHAGEVHAICGENGAGKSTLMKIVSGVYPPDSGELFADGEKQAFSNPMEAYQKGVAIIFQETSLFEEMTVLENLFLGRESQKKIGFMPILDYADMKQKAKAIFKKLNAGIDIHAKIKTLGMAQKQIVEIAKGLTFDAKILIFDEPTASLTQREVDALFKTINQLKSEGMGVVYISHRLEEIFEICDKVTVIRDGQHISTKNVGDTHKDELVADMVGRAMNNYYPKTETKLGEVFFRVENFYDEGFLRDISFEARRGEILGFAGLAGAGRTELMEACCGLAPKASGRLFLDGRELEVSSYAQAMRQGLVYVSEDRRKYGLVVDMSIEENISLPQLQNFSRKYLINKRQEALTAGKYIKDVRIKAPSSEFTVGNLSGGNQQKVAIAKALALKPSILILDEPTRGVDVNAKAEIHKIISELTAQGLTILMISSELPELLGMCDRIYVMKEGCIAGCFNRKEATQDNILKVALEG